MRSARLILALAFILVTSLAVLSADAGTMCYRVKVSFKGIVLVDQVVPFYCSQPASMNSGGTTFYVRG